MRAAGPDHDRGVLPPIRDDGDDGDDGQNSSRPGANHSRAATSKCQRAVGSGLVGWLRPAFLTKHQIQGLGWHRPGKQETLHGIATGFA